ncbi:MAG: hypothetical protein V4451_17250 [Pseudomonadota bacterium]
MAFSEDASQTDLEGIGVDKVLTDEDRFALLVTALLSAFAIFLVLLWRLFLFV